jgi:hypothetical protein
MRTTRSCEITITFSPITNSHLFIKYRDYQAYKSYQLLIKVLPSIENDMQQFRDSDRHGISEEFSLYCAEVNAFLCLPLLMHL